MTEDISKDETYNLKSRMREYLVNQTQSINSNLDSSYHATRNNTQEFDSFGNVVHLLNLNSKNPSYEKVNTSRAENASASIQTNFQMRDNSNRNREKCPQSIKKLSTNQMNFWLDNKWVINPDHQIRNLWDLYVLMPCLVFTAIRVPYAFGFNLNEFDLDNQLFWFVLNRIVDLVFVCDMCVAFITALKDGKMYNTAHLAIIIKYLRSWFVVDLVATVPLDLIFWLANDAGSGGFSRSAKLLRVAKIFRTLRILRLFRVKRIATTLEISCGLNVSMFSVIKFCVVFLLLAHMLACALLAVGTEQAGENSFKNYEHGAGLNMHSEDEMDMNGTLPNYWLAHTPNTETKTQQYTAALHWATQTMTTIGYGDIKLRSDIERILGLIAMIIGGACFTYGITRIVHVVSMMDKAQTNMVEEITAISEWSSYYDFPTELVEEIRAYYRYKNSTQYFDEKNLLEMLSVPLRRDVMHYMFSSFFHRIPLFQDMENSFLIEIMLRLETELAPPFSLIFQECCIADALYIIRRGHCGSFVGCNTPQIQHVLILNVANCFGESSVLEEVSYMPSSVVALEWCDLAKIRRPVFLKVMKYFPHEYKILQERVRIRQQQYFEQMFELENPEYSLESTVTTVTSGTDIFSDSTFETDSYNSESASFSDSTSTGNNKYTSAHISEALLRVAGKGQQSQTNIMNDFMDKQLDDIGKLMAGINQRMKSSFTHNLQNTEKK